MTPTVAPVLAFSYSGNLNPPVQVFSFDGATSMSQAAVAFPTTGVTVSCWLNCPANALATAVVLSYDAQGDNSHRLWIRNPTNLEIGFGAASTGPTGAAVNDAVWHQIAVTLEPSGGTHYSVHLYIDGVLVYFGVGAIAHPAGTTIESGGTLVLASGIGGSAETNLIAQMSEFRLFQGVSTADAIMTALQVRFTGNEPGRVIYWALDSPATSGTVTGASTFVASNLQFRRRQLLASWNAVDGATSYTLRVVSADGCFDFTQTQIPGTSFAVEGFSVNTRYTATVQAVPGGISQPQTVLGMDLQPVLPAIANPSGLSLSAQWPPVDQVEAYRVILTKNVTPAVVATTMQAANSFSLDDLLQNADSFSFVFAAESRNSFGPSSSIVPQQPIALTFLYFNVSDSTQFLQVNWTDPTTVLFFYLQVLDTGTNTFVANAVVAGGQSSFPNIPGLRADGTQLTARIRGVTMGLIGVWTAPVPVTIHNLVAPAITSATGDPAAHTITMNWSSPSGNGITFNAELWDSTATNRLMTASTAQTSVVFTNPAIVDGTSFQVRVQAQQDNSIGRWSGFTIVSVNSLPQVSGLWASAPAPSLDLSAGWTAVSVQNIQYQVRVQGPGVDTTQSTTNSTITFLNSTFHFQQNQTYTVTVTVTQGTKTGPPASTTVVVGTITPVCPACQPNNPKVDDPVNAAMGSYSYSHVDLSVSSVIPLEFITSYNSMTPTPAESPLYDSKPMGNRWTHAYNTKIVHDSAGVEVYVQWGTGVTDTYLVPNSVTGIYPIKGIPNGSTLFLGFDQTAQALIFTLTAKDQTQYRFNNDGQMLQLLTPAGNSLALAYTGGKLSQVTDVQTNRFLSFQYFPSGFLQTVADNSGRSVSYVFFPNGDLQTVNGVLGKPRSFTYATPSLIETIVDENLHTMVKSVYTNGKVTFQQDARAVATNQNYGSTLQYTPSQQDGVDIVITNYSDRAGNQAEFRSVAANGNMLSAIYQLGNQIIRAITRTYDALNNVLTDTMYEGPQSAYTPGIGNTTVYAYDGIGNLLRVTDPAGLITSCTYDGNNNLATLTDYLGNLTIYAYVGNLLQTVTDCSGKVLEHLEYLPGNIKGLIHLSTDSVGNTFTFDYQAGDLLRITDPLQNVLTLGTDNVGRPTSLQIADKNQTVFRTTGLAYWPDNQMKTVSLRLAGQAEADAYASQFVFDGVGNLKTVTDPAGTTITYGYDPNNCLETVAYPAFQGAARQTTYQYDRIDNLQKTVESADVQSSYVFDQFGRIVRFTDGNLRVYSYVYDTVAAGANVFNSRTTTTYPPLGNPPITVTERRTYDPAGRLIAVEDRRQLLTAIAYRRVPNGCAKESITITLPPANPGDPPFTIQEIYDSRDRLTSVQDEAGKITTFQYTDVPDPITGTNQEVLTITGPANNRSAFTMDALGRLVTIREGDSTLNRVRNLEYDPLYRLVRVSALGPKGTVATNYGYLYDSTSKRVNVSIGNPGSATSSVTQQFNGAGQLIQEVDALGKSRSFTYAPWGDVASYTNRRSQILSYGFDTAGRFVQTTLPAGAGTITHVLDGNGNRTQTLRDQAIVIQRAFDEWNRLKSRTNQGKVVGYDYFPTGQLKTLTYTDAKTVARDIDGLGRLHTVTDWNSRVTTYGYTPTGLVNTVTYPNGWVASSSFDDSGRLTGFSHKKDTLILAQVSYVLDALGDRHTSQAIYPAFQNLPAQSLTFTYNAVDEIVTFQGQTLAYDGDGNLTQGLPSGTQLLPMQYDVFSRLETAGGDMYSYDEDGFRTGTTVAGAARSYVYDVAGYESPMLEIPDRLRSVNGAQILTTPYPGAALVPQLGSSNVAASFDDSLDRMIEIAGGQGAIENRLVHGMGLISQEAANGDYWIFHFDANGSTIARTDAQGNAVNQYVYDPFGQVTAANGEGFNVFRYNGRDGVVDDGNGLLYMRARGYAPGLFRFLQRDYLLGDLANPPTLNRYAYALGDPIALIDPLGLSGNSDTAKKILIGLGIAGAVGVLGYLLGTAISTGAPIGTVLGPRPSLPGVPRPPNGPPSGGRPSGNLPSSGSPSGSGSWLPRNSNAGGLRRRRLPAQDIELQSLNSSGRSSGELTTQAKNLRLKID